MVGKIVKVKRCVHCLQYVGTTTADHVFPDAWYPDTTPPTVQRWTVPSCLECNTKHGQLETDLLTRLILCVDPRSDAVSGLEPKVMRSLGLDAEHQPESEKAHRNARRAKIRAELLPSAQFEGRRGIVPGMPSHQGATYSIPIPYAGLSIIAEKICRGCEYKVAKRYIEQSYGVRTAISDSDVVPEPLEPFVKTYDFGPGCKIRRLVASEDKNAVRYWMTIWKMLHLRVFVDHEDYLCELVSMCGTPEAIAEPETPRMRIPPYLQRLSSHS